MPNDNRNNRIDYIELAATSELALAKTKLFYEKAFGWTYKDYGPAYADTQSSGVASGIAAHSKQRSEPLPVIYADDLEASRAAAVAAGAKLTKDIFSFPGGRRFQFTDPAGNELAVWSEK
jgi:predicted enzyme related to lactoylglutathione lyase